MSGFHVLTVTCNCLEQCSDLRANFSFCILSHGIVARTNQSLMPPRRHPYNYGHSPFMLNEHSSLRHKAASKILIARYTTRYTGLATMRLLHSLD